MAPNKATSGEVGKKSQLRHIYGKEDVLK